MRAEVPSALTEERLRAADRVIIVGEARVPELEGVEMERWIPARAPEELATERERMEFLRDDLAAAGRVVERGTRPDRQLIPGGDGSAAGSVTRWPLRDP